MVRRREQDAGPASKIRALARCITAALYPLPAGSQHLPGFAKSTAMKDVLHASDVPIQAGHVTGTASRDITKLSVMTSA